MLRVPVVVVIVSLIGCSAELKEQSDSNAAVTLPESSQTDSPTQTESTEVDGDVFDQFVQSPSREGYLKLRRELVESSAYRPYSDEIRNAEELFSSGKIKEAQKLIQNSKRNLMLSPRAHQFLGFLHHKMGDEQGAQAEMMIAFACLEGILATGDGSEDAPYVVLRTSDEYDVLEYLGKESKKQSLLQLGEKHIDLIECVDGTEYRFDVTDAYNQLSELMAR